MLGLPMLAEWLSVFLSNETSDAVLMAVGEGCVATSGDWSSPEEQKDTNMLTV